MFTNINSFVALHISCYLIKKNVSGNWVKCIFQAINGHLSLSHAAWAPDSFIMETNQTVKHWKEQFKVHYPNMSLSSYAGYAYDAVWMFALALEQLSKEDPSALSNIHSPETTK